MPWPWRSWALTWCIAIKVANLRVECSMKLCLIITVSSDLMITYVITLSYQCIQINPTIPWSTLVPSCLPPSCSTWSSLRWTWLKSTITSLTSSRWDSINQWRQRVSHLYSRKEQEQGIRSPLFCLFFWSICQASLLPLFHSLCSSLRICIFLNA